MIASFLHDGLRVLLETGKSKKVRPDLQGRTLRVLQVLDAASCLNDLAVPGFRTHPLKPSARHAIWVSAQWRVTFEWVGQNATRVDLEQYH